MGVVEFGLLWMSSVWLGWKIIRKFLFTLREDDPDEIKESTLNNGESSGSASQLSFTNLFTFLTTIQTDLPTYGHRDILNCELLAIIIRLTKI